MKEYVTKKDIIIPSGTIFKSTEGEVVEWQNNEYEGTVKLSKDSMQFFTVNEEYINKNSEIFACYPSENKGPKLHGTEGGVDNV